MSIEGAKKIEEVDAGAWLKLATEARYSARFARQAIVSMIERVLTQAEVLAGLPDHDNENVKRVLDGIYDRVE